jgi:hypothetical protein
MIGLSDNQLEIVMSAAEPMADETCQEFLERIAAAVTTVLQERGQINDDDVSAAVQLALRDLIHNSAAWKNWNRNSTRQDGQFDPRLVGPPSQPEPRGDCAATVGRQGWIKKAAGALFGLPREERARDSMAAI